jgi:hypothetical protein
MGKRLKIYVAGAYSESNVLGVLKNIGRGEEWAAKLFMEGFAPFTPWHDKTFVIQHWRLNFSVQDFYDYSMEWLSVSDAVFVVKNYEGLKNWQDSKGTLAEIEKAKELNIPVFFKYEDLETWRQKH